MFYQGSLQEGISTAVGQQKLVLCFVTSMYPYVPACHVSVRRGADRLPKTRMKRVSNGRMSFSMTALYASAFQTLCLGADRV